MANRGLKFVVDFQNTMLNVPINVARCSAGST